MDTAAIDGLLQQAVVAGVLPWVVAMIGDREGTLYEGVYGRLSVESDEPARANTMFWIASMTKAVVSVAALQLIERGELELDQPVAEIVPRSASWQSSTALTSMSHGCARWLGP